MLIFENCICFLSLLIDFLWEVAGPESEDRGGTLYPVSKETTVENKAELVAVGSSLFPKSPGL